MNLDELRQSFDSVFVQDVSIPKAQFLVLLDRLEASERACEAAAHWVETAENAGKPKDINDAYITMNDCFDAAAACKDAVEAWRRVRGEK